MTNKARRMAQVLISFPLMGAVLFLTAGSIRWTWAWMFLLVSAIILAINAFVIPQEVIEERGRKKTNVKKWDRILSGIISIPYFGIYILSGLEHRFGWSLVRPGTQILGLALFLAGSLLFTWSMCSNKFFSTLVRIQEEQGHQVATGGPYRFVRHPGYLAFIVFTTVMPVALGSLYGLILSGLVAILLVIRTALEDRTLIRELNGYLEYTKKIKFRLIPFVW